MRATATVNLDPVTVRVADVSRLTGMSIREIWRKAADSESGFPKPRKLSMRVTVWDYRAVRRWVEEQGEVQS